MATVYVVTSGEYSAYRIEGVFSTQEGAERLAAEFRAADVADIMEWKVDERAENVRQPVYRCWMNKEGAIFVQDQIEDIVAPRYSFVFTYAEGNIETKSAVSPEHAVKLAAEARQKWLREQCLI